ncbi:ATP-binding protein [Methylomicrobium sp. RS1]|uniref:ATP-binding protein n=1 Tax=Candidatus Methylomicrobium oryzae TaxID=2802053 RepID=UPI001923B709|nr:HAMP domain-containing protein [Methylomicrobium sp. RS1]
MRFPKTLFGRVFALLMVMMVFNFAVLFALLVLFVLFPAGHHYGYLSKTIGVLVEEIAQQSDDESKRRLTERLKQRAGVTMAWDAEERGSAPPRRPFFIAWQRALQENPKDGLVILYQRDRGHTLWLQHRTFPVFSLGFPAENLLGMPFFMLLALLIALALSTIAAFWTARRLSRPLQTLAETASRLGLDLRSVEIHPDGPEEIRAVGQALNRLRFNLDHLIREQEFLLAGISHDLCTPLARLRLSVEMLGADSDDLGDGMKEDIEEINLILQHFIELTRFNIEETEPWEAGDITPLLIDVAQKYRRADVDLKLLLGKIPPVRYKPLALRRLLYNLIDNGIKHGGGSVSVTAAAVWDRVDVCVADLGPGGPEPETGRNPGMKESRGSGLGLQIVRRIAELHGAELKFGNGPQGGAEIVLSLKPYAGQP